MMGQYGYAGKILRVDLTSRNVTNVHTLDYAEKFIGGRGFATKIYWDEMPSDINAFDPENKVIIVTGPLGGIPGLSGSMWQIYGKSPITIPEQFCSASLGGHWGAYLKFAGYDGVIVQGKSDSPVYFLIQDGTAEIRDASHLWGKGSVETREILKSELRDSIRVMAIGPAGENMVRFATVLAENDASGSSGFGAVLGSKRLKAIAVAGSNKVTAANPEELQRLTNYVSELNRDKRTVPVPIAVTIDGVTEKTYACYGCRPCCDRTVAQTSDGKRSKRFCHSGEFYQGYVGRYYGEYNDVIIQATRLCNEYGLNTKEIDGLIQWMSKCNEAG
ncbi:aldehyde ferredoxin oxidoreductase N-terminal domain-containing protein, partial [Chloroflexota bacterium]